MLQRWDSVRKSGAVGLHTATKRMPRITYRKRSIHGASTTNTQGPLTFLTDDVTLRGGGGAGSCLNPWGLVCQKVGVG